MRRSGPWVLGLLLLAGAALGQEEAPGPLAPRDEAFRMVDAYLISNMQESLGLSDEQFAKAIPLVKQLQRDRREYVAERGRVFREMRRLLRSGGASEADLVKLLDRSKTLEREGPERNRKNLAELDALLTPLQQAKYRVLEGEVELRVRELGARVRGARPAPRQPRDP